MVKSTALFCCNFCYVIFSLAFNIGCSGRVGNDNPVCGDIAAEAPELCDGTDLRGEDCSSIGLGFTHGVLTCAASCLAWDTSACSSTTEECGDGLREGDELCDGADLNGQNCTTVPGNYIGGALACSSGCLSWDTDACINNGTYCGDDIREGVELCDGSDLGGADCTDVPGAFSGGDLACSTDCIGWNTAGCTGGNPLCGNGVIDASEVCDDQDLGGQSCTAFGYGAGRSYCSASCDRVLISACYSTDAVCGDGVAEPLEQCDGLDLTGWDCDTLGYTGGSIGCRSDCTLDLTGCTGDPCADADVPSNGLCDTCGVQPAGAPDPECLSICTSADGFCTSVIDAVTNNSSCLLTMGSEDPDCGACGDGAASFSEWCDGLDLGFYICEDFGFSGGDLTCDGNCNYDFTSCF